MKKLIQKIMMASTICALAFLAPQLARADKYEIVSNLTNAIFSSAASTTLTADYRPIDRIWNRQHSAALLQEAHPCAGGYPYCVSTNRYKGSWTGLTDPAIVIRDIVVDEDKVVITTEERFLIYVSLASYNSNYGGNSIRMISCEVENIVVDQTCEPPAPWTSRGVYAPYCRNEMTNRVEHYESAIATREVIGYYDGDGDGYATATRLAVIESDDGDYLDESATGPYWMMNDVLIVKYTISRTSSQNYIYGTEDAVNHYWRAVSSLYSIHLESTPLKPWWQMPEYQ